MATSPLACCYHYLEKLKIQILCRYSAQTHCSILGNHHNAVQHFFVDNPDTVYNPRPRKHNKTVITKSAQLNNRNFFIACAIPELLLTSFILFYLSIYYAGLRFVNPFYLNIWWWSIAAAWCCKVCRATIWGAVIQVPSPVLGRGTFLLFSFFIGFTYFLLLSIPSLSTRIVPLRFQVEGRRRRPNLGLVYCVYLCYLYSLVKMDSGVLFYLV